MKFPINHLVTVLLVLFSTVSLFSLSAPSHQISNLSHNGEEKKSKKRSTQILAHFLSYSEFFTKKSADDSIEFPSSCSSHLKSMFRTIEFIGERLQETANSDDRCSSATSYFQKKTTQFHCLFLTLIDVLHYKFIDGFSFFGLFFS